MSTTSVDIEVQLADALRVLLPLAVSDEPEWLPERDRLSRHVAYNMGFLALLEYEEAQAKRARFPVVDEATAALSLVA